MNATAKIYRTNNAKIDLDRILNVGAFDLERTLKNDPQFLEPEYPFEWGGVYKLEPGKYELVVGQGEHHEEGHKHGHDCGHDHGHSHSHAHDEHKHEEPKHKHEEHGHSHSHAHEEHKEHKHEEHKHDHDCGHDHGAPHEGVMSLVLLPTTTTGQAGLDAVAMDAVLTFAEKDVHLHGSLVPGKTHYHIHLHAGARIPIEIKQAGHYAMFAEHHLDEVGAELRGAHGKAKLLAMHVYKPEHTHADEVTSVGITIAGDLNAKKLNAWFQKLLAEKGGDIFRMKGVLSMKGDPNRFIFQGVHMTFDGKPDRPWGNTPRSNKLIFIGRHLNREELENGFKACLA